MRHKCPVLTVKKWLKSVSIYGSYRKNKTGVPFFGTPCIIIPFAITSTERHRGLF